MKQGADQRPLIAHVMYRFDVGGLENGVVNLINSMPVESYRHAVIALTEVTEFRRRIVRNDVEFIGLGKGPGHVARIYPSLYRLMRRLRPAIVHTRNLAALEVTVPAWAAGIPVRIHGEHGRDVGDLDGSNRKYQWIRRLYDPFVSHYIALSRDLESYLAGPVGVRRDKISQIYNGVDIAKFHPAGRARGLIPDCPFVDPGLWIVGTVGRMQAVKDQTSLARAFVEALRSAPELKSRLRLVMVGGGPLREQSQAILAAAGLGSLCWLPGERADIPEILRGLDCFVLPSLAEGISNTILEAMASALPVIATAVGGNTELVNAGVTGALVPAGESALLAAAIVAMARDQPGSRAAGAAGRAVTEQRYSLQSMTSSYKYLYDTLRGQVRSGSFAVRTNS